MKNIDDVTPCLCTIKSIIIFSHLIVKCVMNIFAIMTIMLLMKKFKSIYMCAQQSVHEHSCLRACIFVCNYNICVYICALGTYIDRYVYKI